VFDISLAFSLSFSFLSSSPFLFVIPPKAGIQEGFSLHGSWIPAFAGMTVTVKGSCAKKGGKEFTGRLRKGIY